jgi:tetratricopeptide (TPR) repeat protein
MEDEGQDLISQAYARRRTGDAEGALALYRRAELGLAGDAKGRAHCLRHIGDLERELGRRGEAREALRKAEHLYRGPAADSLSLANTVRLQALLESDPARWREARALYEQAAAETGLDLTAAFAECDRHLG